jgi:NADH-quinone oxidoreductase subunit D
VIRTFNLELSRLASFLMGLGGQAGAFGHGTVAQWSIAHRDYVIDLFEEMTAAGVPHVYGAGGVRGPCRRALSNARGRAAPVEKLLDEIEKVLLNNAVFKMRAMGLGIITPDMVDAYGIVGPNARAAGVARDLRKDNPYLVYPQLDFSVITQEVSDAYHRCRLRWLEMKQSVSLIRQCLQGMPRTGEYHAMLPNPLHWRIPAGETYVAAECTRGEYGYYMVSDGSATRAAYIARPKLHTRHPPYGAPVPGARTSPTSPVSFVSLHTYPPEIER